MQFCRIKLKNLSNRGIKKDLGFFYVRMLFLLSGKKFLESFLQRRCIISLKFDYISLLIYFFSMESGIDVLDIGDFKSVFSGAKVRGIEGCFFITKFSGSDDLERLRSPFRFDGYFLVFCSEGQFNVDVNMTQVEMGENLLMLQYPMGITCFGNFGVKETEGVVIAASKEYLSSIRFDFNKLFNDSIVVLGNPRILLEEEERRICVEYIMLINRVLGASVGCKGDAVEALLSSVFYYLASVWKERIEVKSAVGAQQERLSVIFEQFLHLVNLHYADERNMAFYAEKLELTPKYLSKLIKQVSGRSGPDWINTVVVVAAKKMLRYSGSTIKEIVEGLHFPNQSVFYKFFKIHTGMTPSEYRTGKRKIGVKDLE